MNLGRRRILADIAKLAALCHVPTGSMANTPAQFSARVAEHVKRLVDKDTGALRILLPHGSLANVDPVVASFKVATGMQVSIQEAPVDEINTQLLLDSMSGENSFDVALPATFGLPDLISTGAIIALSDYAKKYEPADYRQEILYNTGDSFDNELYGFQTDGDAYLMFYHKDLLDNKDEQARYADKFGDVLTIPQTWQELDRQMAFFNRPEQNLYGGLLFRTNDYLAWEWWVRFHAKGIWPLSEDLVPQIDSDSGVEALEEMILATAHLAPEVRTLGLFENWERYSKGDVYCNIGWGGTQKYLNGVQSDMKDRLKFGPTPGGIVNDRLLLTPYFNWGWNYVVTVNSQMPEIAYLFALFASTPEISTASVRQAGGFFDPFRPEHYSDAGIQKAYSQEFLDVHKQSMKSAIPDLYLAGQSRYFSSLTDGLRRALGGQSDPASALKSVADQWNLITERNDKLKQKGRWKLLRQKYPLAVQAALVDVH